jgi:tryptophan halogenase
MQAPIRKMVIVGGGTAGWMAAAWFSRMLGHNLREIVLVESEEIGTVGVGEATVPSFRRFNEIIGAKEDELVRGTFATFKLAIQFVNWGRIGERYYHPFGPNGRSLNGLPFHAAWLAGQPLGASTTLNDYNLQALACEKGKFIRPMGENSPLATIAYAYQFDAGLYARFLRRLAEARGVSRIEGRIAKVNQCTDNGFIESVTLDRGEEVSGDLFLDCSGFRGLLINETLEAPFLDWSHWLPCDRAVVTQSESDGRFEPYTRATAHAAGWQWRIPLQHRIGNGHVYSSAHISDDEALEVLTTNLDTPARTDPRVLRFKAGRRKAFWVKNCVAVGLAAGFLEPLESTSIYLIQGALGRLQVLFPDRGFEQADIDCFNVESTKEYEYIRDFIILHYKLTQRDDSPFWDYCRTMDVPERITEKIRLFGSRGRIFEENREQFGLASWLAVMAGQGVKPRGGEPLLANMNERDLMIWLNGVKEVVAQCCDFMPTHEDFLKQHNLFGHSGET